MLPKTDSRSEQGSVMIVYAFGIVFAMLILLMTSNAQMQNSRTRATTQVVTAEKMVDAAQQDVLTTFNKWYATTEYAWNSTVSYPANSVTCTSKSAAAACGTDKDTGSTNPLYGRGRWEWKAKRIMTMADKICGVNPTTSDLYRTWEVTFYGAVQRTPSAPLITSSSPIISDPGSSQYASYNTPRVRCVAMREDFVKPDPGSLYAPFKYNVSPKSLSNYTVFASDLIDATGADFTNSGVPSSEAGAWATNKNVKFASTTGSSTKHAKTIALYDIDTNSNTPESRCSNCGTVLERRLFAPAFSPDPYIIPTFTASCNPAFTSDWIASDNTGGTGTATLKMPPNLESGQDIPCYNKMIFDVNTNIQAPTSGNAVAIVQNVIVKNGVSVNVSSPKNLTIMSNGSVAIGYVPSLGAAPSSWTVPTSLTPTSYAPPATAITTVEAKIIAPDADCGIYGPTGNASTGKSTLRGTLACKEVYLGGNAGVLVSSTTSSNLVVLYSYKRVFNIEQSLRTTNVSS